jgi:hypothetical protein
MLQTKNITFAVATNNRKTLESNFLSSRCFGPSHPHQILLQEGFSSAARAYNHAIDRSVNDLIVFAHQDIIFPASWLNQLERVLKDLEVEDPNWGVLGCFGQTHDDSGRGYIYSSGLGVIGEPFRPPAPVETLDETVLIFRISSGLRFDETLPHFHMYGADICLAAAKRGRKSYAISAFCIHNTDQTLVLPSEFYECCQHIKLVWRDRLPIRTTCITISKFNFPIYRRRLNDVYLRYIRRKELGGTRTQDVEKLLSELESVQVLVGS